MKGLALLAVSSFALACGGSTPPPQSPSGASSAEVDALSQRVEKLEERLEAMEETRQSAESNRERIDALRQQLGSIEARLADRRPPPPPRRRFGPDPAKVYAVAIDGAPYRGADTAWVTMVMGFEFADPFSNRVRATLDELLVEYDGDLKIVFRNYIVHPQLATEAAYSGCAVAKQGRKKFNRYFQLVFDKAFEAGRDFSTANLEKLAKEAGAKLKKFRKARDGDCVDIVKQDQADLARVGQRGTPAFYINGRYLGGARPTSQFKTLIDEELAKAKKSGIKKKKYYDHILKTGLKSASDD